MTRAITLALRFALKGTEKSENVKIMQPSVETEHLHLWPCPAPLGHRIPLLLSAVGVCWVPGGRLAGRWGFLLFCSFLLFCGTISLFPDYSSLQEKSRTSSHCQAVVYIYLLSDLYKTHLFLKLTEPFSLRVHPAWHHQAFPSFSWGGEGFRGCNTPYARARPPAPGVGISLDSNFSSEIH